MKLRSIQVLRGVAASGVVCQHAWPGLTKGATGVDLFFVISGFIMASIPKGPSFLFDRFWRIFPLWWIAVLPWIFFTRPAWPKIAASLTLWPIYAAWTVPALRVGWTLSFEMLFYFALAASMRIGVKPVLAMFALMLAGAALIRWPIFNYLGNPMIFEFLFGVAIVALPKAPRLALPMLAVALGVLAISPAWVGDVSGVTMHVASAWRVLWWGDPAALIVYACVSAEDVFAGRWWLPALILGDASYSIYLFHPAVLTVASGLFGAVLAIAAGLAAWWLLERRIIALRPALRRFNLHDVSALAGRAVGREIEHDGPA